MKKPYNWNSLIDSFDDCNCPYAYIVSYYLSRFDKGAYQKLGFGNMSETHQKIGSILKILEMRSILIIQIPVKVGGKENHGLLRKKFIKVLKNILKKKSMA